MIVITDIKWYEVEGDRHQIYVDSEPFGRFEVVGGNLDQPFIGCETVIEHIQGRIFCRNRGDGVETIVIGMDKEVQDVLGWQEEAWESNQKLINSQMNTINSLKDELAEIRRMSFIGRMKFLFRGYRYGRL